VPEESVQKFVDKLNSQKNIDVDYQRVSGAAHYFNNDNEAEIIKDLTGTYLDRRIAELLAAE